MKFSIVTPAYNSERFIAETIESVLSQKGDFEIEYIVMDGGSTDRTVDIARAYEQQLRNGTYPTQCTRVSMQVFSEKDGGMYDAINKGFARATGDIYAWINSDDSYLSGAFAVIARVAKKFPDVVWFKGKTAVITEDGQAMYTIPCYLYNQEWIARGIYGRNAYYIHQDSVFWRRELWKQAGPIDAHLRYAGDYYLWVQFGKHAPLYSINTTVSRFRKVQGSLSLHDQGLKYRKEVREVSPGARDWFDTKIKIFFTIKTKMHIPDGLAGLLYPLLFWKRQKQYIALASGEPTLTNTHTYIA